MRKLSKKEQGILEELANDTELGFRGLLRRFILGNTYEPKYKVGDYVKITDNTSTYICGARIKNLNARITEVTWIMGSAVKKGEEHILYECEVKDQNGKGHFACVEEAIDTDYTCKLRSFVVGKSDTDINNFPNADKGDYIIP